MIDFIRTWGTALICAAVVGSICNVLLPNHSIAKAAKLVVGIYLAIVIVTPFVGVALDAPQSIEFTIDESYGTELYDEAVLRETAEKIKAGLAAKLESSGVICDELTISVNINDTGGIYCDRIALVLSNQYREKQQEISAIVAELCGIEPEMTYRD